MTSVKNNNVNVLSRIESNNVNDNVRRKSEKQVDLLANYIMQRLGATDNRLFYLKVSWTLSEATINNHIEVANKGKNPLKYFSWLAKRSLEQRNTN